MSMRNLKYGLQTVKTVFGFIEKVDFEPRVKKEGKIDGHYSSFVYNILQHFLK